MPAVKVPKAEEASEVEREIMRLILRYMGVPIYEHDAAVEAPVEAPGGVLWFKEERRQS